jgi:hypothetical protein
MPFKPTPPTHHCQKCHKALWDNRWPYTLCKTCSAAMACPHGNKLGECAACDFDSDRAYDASRGA